MAKSSTNGGIGIGPRSIAIDLYPRARPHPALFFCHAARIKLTSPAGNPLPATGEMIFWEGVFPYRIEDGQITEEWWDLDSDALGAIDYCQ
jgi:hypothetical protein